MAASTGFVESPMDSAKASCAATDSAAEDPWPAAGKSSLDIFIDIGLSVN
jgi:hypothetical protein